MSKLQNYYTTLRAPSAPFKSAPGMEEVLLPENDKETGSTRVATWKIYVEELKRVNGIALPMMVATVGQYLLRVSPIFMLGHLGQLQLSGASIATSFSNVTGFSVLVSPFP